MAKLPQIRRLYAEDYGKENADLVSKLAPNINQFMDGTYSALNKNLTFTDNFIAQIHEFQIKTLVSPATPFPYSFKLDFSTKPTGVLVLQAIATASPQTPSSTSNPAWEYFEVGGKPQIRIRSLPGLADSTIYRIRLLVLGG